MGLVGHKEFFVVALERKQDLLMFFEVTKKILFYFFLLENIFQNILSPTIPATSYVIMSLRGSALGGDEAISTIEIAALPPPAGGGRSQ